MRKYHTTKHLTKKWKTTLKKVLKKFAAFEKVATFASAIEKQTLGWAFWKSFEKSFKIFWRFKKLDLSLHPLSPHNESERSKKKVWKIFQKDLVVSKKGFTFAPLSALKKRLKLSRSSDRHRNRICSYSDIRTAFFEEFEQQSFYPLERVISNNTFEIRAKDLTKHFFTMESLILAQDER